LKKYKLGELIELCDERNSDNQYKLSDVKGISIKKEFIETKADMAGVSLLPYILVEPNSFAYVTVTSRNGEKITLAHNTSNKTYIVSSSYIVFKINRPDIILSDYLFMFFNRPEFDRYARFNSWGSARETFSWEDFCDIDITLPSIEQQRKYVDVYLALQNNLAVYQSKAEDLKMVCDGYIEELRRRASKSIPMVRIGDYISKRVEKNSDGAITLEQGINIQKQFITPQRSNSDLYGRRIVRKGDFAYCTQLNNENVAIAYREEEDCVVSSVYDIFYIKDESVLFPLYLMLWFRRSEFGRYVYRLSTGTSYEFLSYEDLSDYKIPLPDITIQKEIANIYKCYIERQRIAEALKEQIKNICPVLIRGSLT
jgi:type I restriction enzyme S subunit